MTLAYRESSIPFSYLGGDAQPTGFGFEICEKIADRVKAATGRSDLKKQYQAVTSANRIPLLQNGTIDIECGSTTNNSERGKQVAFAINYFYTGTRFLVKTGTNVNKLADLAGKPVVSTTGTTNFQIIRKLNEEQKLGIDLLGAKDHAESALMVQTGRAVAFGMDDILLYGLRASSQNPAELSVVGEPIQVEPYAIMVRKDDPAFKKLVDDTLAAMMKSGEFEALYKKWFQSPIPPKGINLNAPMSKELIDNMKALSDKPRPESAAGASAGAMTLTELRYVVAVAREKHFGRAAEACFVSQPTLSVSIKKLEEELDVRIFERGANEVSVTPIGEEIVRQAQAVIEQAAQIKETAKRRKDPLSGPLSLGVIYTIGPYLLPELVRQAIERVPQMPLDAAGELHRQAARAAALGRARLRDHGRAVSRHRPGDRAALRRAVHGRGAEEPSARQAQGDQRRRAEAGEDAAARHRPLLSRPRARGLPRVRAVLVGRLRRHPQDLRGLVARDDQVHGRLGHGRDGRAAALGARRGRRRTSPTCRSPSRCRRAASSSPGGAASPATRRSPRCATRSMPAS